DTQILKVDAVLQIMSSNSGYQTLYQNDGTPYYLMANGTVVTWNELQTYGNRIGMNEPQFSNAQAQGQQVVGGSQAAPNPQQVAQSGWRDYLATGLRFLGDVSGFSPLGNYLASRLGGQTQIPNATADHSSPIPDIGALQDYIAAHNGGQAVDLSKGTHVVLLENYFNDDPKLSPQDRANGFYASRGPDTFQGRIFIIRDGLIVAQDGASSHASLTSNNAYRDLQPGEYVMRGQYAAPGTTEAGHFGNRYFEIFSSEDNMAANNRVVPAQYTGGPLAGQFTTQDGILSHWATGPGAQQSGSLGCQVFLAGMVQTLPQIFPGDSLSGLVGRFYLVDRNRPDVYQSIQQRVR
ncbi:MAG TPA: hypothetical protein PLD60_15130, partial [Leptospiraceae bacterium]|nr:hypothetical protein [Leptospiraceae bacterium]